MKHRVKIKKFGQGIDANRMLFRKLMLNFLQNAKLTTTISKAKALKSALERVISKSRVKTESNKNYLLKFFPKRVVFDVMFDQVGPAFPKLTGGYVRVVRLSERVTDGAMIGRVEWAHPVVIKWIKEEKAVAKKSAAKTKAPEEKKVKPETKKVEKVQTK